MVTYRSVGASSDYVFSAKVKPIAVTSGQPGNMGIELRSDATSGTPENNLYYFSLSPTENQWKLYKEVNGAMGNPIASEPGTFNLGQYYTIQAVAQGGVIKLYIDGALKYSFTESPYYSYTNIALTARTAKAYFDDVRLEGGE